MSIKMTITALTAAVVFFAGPLCARIQAQAANPKVLIKTSRGDITLELFKDKAPLTVGNFLSYVNDKFYEGTIFHRVIKGFMIQGGGLTEDMHEKASKPPIKNEAGNGVKNKRGTIAMARSTVVNSATCQFFINLVDNGNLNHKDDSDQGFGYCVFGRVLEGMNVVDAIAELPTGSKLGYSDVPWQPITILSVTLLDAD